MGYRLPRQLVGVGVCLQFAWLLSAVPLAWAQNPLRSAWNQFDQFISTISIPWEKRSGIHCKRQCQGCG